MVSLIVIQWNPSIATAFGKQNFARYIGVAFIEGLFCAQTVISQLAFIQGWPLRGVFHCIWKMKIPQFQSNTMDK